MSGLWRRLLSGGRATGTPGSRPRTRRRATPEVAPLEGRTLLFVTPTATAVPSILAPPNGRTVPVTVSGTINSVIDLGVAGSAEVKKAQENIPVPKGTFQVTDQYRRLEPRGQLDLVKLGGINVDQKVDVGGRQELHTFNSTTYTYTVTIPLTAERSTDTPDGRRYYIAIAAGDQDNGNGVTVPVLVPKDAAQAEKALVIQQIRPVRDAQMLKELQDFRLRKAQRRR